MNSIVKSLNSLLENQIFKDKVSLDNFINNHKESLSQSEIKSLLNLFQELIAYKNNKEISIITPEYLDEVLNILKRYENNKEDIEKSSLEEKNILKANHKYENFVFKGTSKEYFKIWIVNIFLTLITLGIYSAWAKVRTNRYIYANTYLKDSSFEYTADPLKILKGRLIVFSFYLLFLLSSQVLLNPTISLIILIFGIVITPWIVTKAIKFKLKNTKYKNINFHYHGNSFEMYKFFLLHLVLNIVTIGLAYPYTYNSFKRLIINNSSYGDTYFNYDGKAVDTYINFIKVILIYVAFVVIIGAAAVFLTSSIMNPHDFSAMNPPTNPLAIIMIMVINFLYLFMFFVLKAFYDAIMQNYIYSHTKLSEFPLKSSLKGGKLSWLYLTNIIAIVFSLGLLYPWTKIRTTKYKLENLYISIDDEFVTKASTITDESALGEEAEEFFDMDIGL